MSSHVDRMKEEFDSLKLKIDKLNEFIYTNDVYQTLPTSEKVSMTQQLGYMVSYLRELDKRIWSSNNNIS